MASRRASSPASSTDRTIKTRGRSDTRTNMIVLHNDGLTRDTPAFRLDLKEKYLNACDFEKKANKVADEVDKYIGSLAGFSALATTLETVLPPDTEASGNGSPTVDFVGLLREITQQIGSLGTQLECMVATPIRDYVANDVQNAKNRYEGYLSGARPPTNMDYNPTRWL